MICTEHRILGKFKLERKNIYFIQTLFAYLKDWCYSKVGSDKRRICGFWQADRRGRFTVVFGRGLNQERRKREKIA